MKKIISISIFCLTLIIVLFSCTKDFITKDIKNEIVSIISPADNLSSPNNSITFWWNELDGAEKYNLQIVKPNFTAVQELVLDTNITSTKFVKTLLPGTYQWRIKAFNNNGSTAYTTRNLIIDTTSNLFLTSVNLISPSNLNVMANNSVTFNWNVLYSATYYEIKLTNIASNSITTISNILTNSYPFTFSTISGNENVYKWQVKAFNGFSQTQNNTERSFKIDLKSPNIPSLLSVNTYSLAVRDTTYLKWSRNASSSDIKYDILSISNDSNFMSVLGTFNSNNVSPVRINSIYTYTGTAQKLWWRVISVDSVLNSSLPNQSKRFYLY